MKEVGIIIVGAGLAGASTAYHLRCLGVTDVVVLEREAAPGEHSSGRNAAMVREKVADLDIQTLLIEGAAAIRRGDLCAFRQTGGILLGPGDANAADYFPLAQGTGKWYPHCGVAEPAGLLQTYLRGVELRCNTRVLDWKSSESGVEVRTTRGIIRGRLLVNAAGAWAGRFGDLAFTPLNRHLFVTPVMQQVDPDWPFVWDLRNGLYFRPESGGLLLCPCDEERREPGDYRIDEEAQIVLGQLLRRHQPWLANVAIKTCWVGQRTFVADRKFVIGFDPRIKSLFHVAGLGGHGVTASYAVGRLAARLLTGAASGDTNPFDPARLLQPSMSRRG
jgi:D-arginine dehydrogenase